MTQGIITWEPPADHTYTHTQIFALGILTNHSFSKLAKLAYKFYTMGCISF